MVPSLTFSVIVPVYNAEAILHETLPDLLGLESASEILLVDDGSADNSLGLLERAASRSSSARVLRHDRNRGRAAARNSGLKVARGAVVLFIDCDVRPRRDVLEKHRLHYENPEVVAVVSNNRPAVIEDGDPYQRYLLERAGPRGFTGDEALPLKYFTTTCTSVRRAAIEAVGPFDEGITYGEDLELGYRLHRRHPRGFRFAPGAVVSQHDVGDLDERSRRLRQFGGNLHELFARHPGLAAEAGLAFVASRPRRGVVELAGRAGRGLLPYAPGVFHPHLIRLALAAAVVEGYRAHPS